MPVIDVVKWNARADIYAWKHPSEELSTWTQVIVAESQEAILVKEGRVLAVLAAGRHTLDTANFPFLVHLLKLPFGGSSPFTAEVWFVNRTIPLDVKWGTSEPIQLQDPKFGIMLPVRAFGQYGVQIENSNQFLQKLVGTLSAFDRQNLNSYFRGLFLTKAKTTIAQYIVRQKISVLEISAHLDEISTVLQRQMAAELSSYGLTLVNFYVNSVNTPDDDPAVARLKAALAKRAEMNVIGYSYQQERSFDVLDSAASNPGQMQSGLMGAGMGIGMGAALGDAMGPVFGQMGAQIQHTGRTCQKCGTQAPPDARFCFNCAVSLELEEGSATCVRCGAKSAAKGGYCPGCGRALRCCDKCGADNDEGAADCARCGRSLGAQCPSCKEPNPPAARFCCTCGKPLAYVCTKCGSKLATGVKFCGTCGEAAEGRN